MNKLIILTGWLVCLALPATAQSSLQTVLQSVESNNPRLATERQFWEVQAPREAIERVFEAADPERKTYEQQRLIAEKQLEVARLYRLPSFEVGYRYQGILGQRFNGLHAGVTLPLWEQKYRTETRQAQVLLADLELARYANARYYELWELYDRRALLGQSLDEYRRAIQLVDNGRLLDKALRLGEITTMEYFLETSLYQNACLHFLQLEYEYHEATAELTKYFL
ncbi:TolC family protein [Lewinella sp. JB7]|uniref:TolC family protein n=1 Tax=Lewinella sp. JB7 TaxID=2962887 RepID=UPI0020C98330|nr:TolC family protein [Lewinella sp. JB7]MCP9234724.1 TolC family protein [Lewinella sp. JB7]